VLPQILAWQSSLQRDFQNAQCVEPTELPTAQMGKMGESAVQIRTTQVAVLAIQAESRYICPLDIGKALAIFGCDLQT